MADINLTQTEANALIAMEKTRVDDELHGYPPLGGSVHIPLLSKDRREAFTLDVYRSRIDLVKGTYQNRGRKVVVLARLDFGGSPHHNPDGEEVACPHLHLYREGFGDKWAYPITQDHFSDPQDRWQMLGDFMRYCNITEPPLMRKGLFT